MVGREGRGRRGSEATARAATGGCGGGDPPVAPMPEMNEATKLCVWASSGSVDGDEVDGRRW